MESNALQPAAVPASTLPDQLAKRTAEAVSEILQEGSSANSMRSYDTAIRYWKAWHQHRYDKPMELPVPTEVVVQFVVDHWARRPKSDGPFVWDLPPEIDARLVAAGVKKRRGSLKLTTILHRVAVLSKFHTQAQARAQAEAEARAKAQAQAQARPLDQPPTGRAQLPTPPEVPNPCEDPRVRHLLSRARRASVKRGERANKKTAITRREFEALIATCDDSLEGVRDRAILYFGFASGGRRRSEVAAADFADLTQVAPGEFGYRLMHSKTTQTGPTAKSTPVKPVLGAAGEALAAWIQASGLSQGPIFRRLWNRRIGEALSPAAIADIVQRRANQAGLQGDFAGHSLRSGFITEGGRQGVSLPALMAMSGHTSVGTVIGYFQAGDVENNPAARLLDTPAVVKKPVEL